MAITGRWGPEVFCLGQTGFTLVVSLEFGCPPVLFYIWGDYISHYIIITVPFSDMNAIMLTLLVGFNIFFNSKILFEWQRDRERLSPI